MVLYLQIICWKLWCWTRDFLQILPKVIVNMLQYNSQKQPSIGVLMKRCSENMQQIYSRTPMPKCDFNKVALQVYWNRTSAWVFSCKFNAYFQNIFSYEHLWRAPFVHCFLCRASTNKILLKEIWVSKYGKVLFMQCLQKRCEVIYFGKEPWGGHDWKGKFVSNSSLTSLIVIFH